MTAVGKILVFMNLLLSVATSGMIVLVFTTRSNWKAEYEKMRNVALVAEAAYKSEKLAHQSDVGSRGSQNESIVNQNMALTTENEGLKTDIDRTKKVLAAQEAKVKLEEAENQKLTTELSSQKVERDILSKSAQESREKTIETQKELNDQRLIATNNRIEADAQTQRARRLLERTEELEKNVVQLTNKLTATGGNLTGGGNRSLLNPDAIPAPRDVHGTIRAVATSGLTVINIGSDSGLSAGNKLLVYRVDARNPKNSLYLGELVVSRTEPKQAVGQFYPKPFAKPDERLPKEDDVVSTSLGNR